MSNLKEQVAQLAEPAVSGMGYELVDVVWTQEQGKWVLRLFIDKEEGVGLEDCAAISREVAVLFDVHDVIPQAYQLEVSSPGLNRPLTRIEHFERFKGQLAKVRLKQGVDGRRNFTGIILEVSPDAGEVTLQVDDNSFTLPLADLDKANLQYEFDN